MITNFPLTKSDQAILKIIFDELVKQGTEITTKNIREHRLFEKIDQKELFTEDDCTINHIGLGFGQKEAGKFHVEFSGTNLDLGNPIHRKFLEELFSKVAPKIALFVRIMGKFEARRKSQSPSLDDFLNEFTKGWKKN